MEEKDLEFWKSCFIASMTSGCIPEVAKMNADEALGMLEKVRKM